MSSRFSREAMVSPSSPPTLSGTRRARSNLAERLPLTPLAKIALPERMSAESHGSFNPFDTGADGKEFFNLELVFSRKR